MARGRKCLASVEPAAGGGSRTVVGPAPEMKPAAQLMITMMMMMTATMEAGRCEATSDILLQLQLLEPFDLSLAKAPLLLARGLSMPPVCAGV